MLLQGEKLKNKMKIVDDYTLLINLLLKYIKEVKTKDNSLSFMDIIMDYSIKNNIDLEYIGDAISTDDYFKALLQKDLEKSKFIKVQKNSVDW